MDLSDNLECYNLSQDLGPLRSISRRRLAEVSVRLQACSDFDEEAEEEEVWVLEVIFLQVIHVPRVG